MRNKKNKEEARKEYDEWCQKKRQEAYENLSPQDKLKREYEAYKNSRDYDWKPLSFEEWVQNKIREAETEAWVNDLVSNVFSNENIRKMQRNIFGNLIKKYGGPVR